MNDDTETLRGYAISRDYVFLRHLGSGSFAAVWLVYSLSRKCFYAMKVQNEEDYDESGVEKKIMMDIARANYPYLNYSVRCFDHLFEVRNDEEETLCMVSDLMAGSLADLLGERRYRRGLPMPMIKAITRQLLLATDTLHRKLGYLHSDISPENILIEGVNTRLEPMMVEVVRRLKEGMKKRKYRKAITDLDVLRQIAEDEMEDEDSEDSDDSDSDVSTDSERSDEQYPIFDLSGFESEESEPESEDDAVESDGDPDIKIRLSDFGSCIPKSQLRGKEIQTRYYRAPEVVLGAGYDLSCDLWSIGCIVYEMVTGEILFRPKKTDGFNRDRHHLQMMISCLGEVPEELLTKSRRRHVFFTEDGLLKGVDYSSRPLAGFLMEDKIKQHTDDPTELIDWLNKLITYPSFRLGIQECLNHKWLST